MDAFQSRLDTNDHLMQKILHHAYLAIMHVAKTALPLA